MWLLTSEKQQHFVQILTIYLRTYLYEAIRTIDLFKQPKCALELKLLNFKNFVNSKNFVCLLTYLPPCPPASLLACLPAYLPTCLPTCLPAHLPASLPPCLPALLPPCLPACLPTCPPTYPPARLLTHLPPNHNNWTTYHLNYWGILYIASILSQYKVYYCPHKPFLFSWLLLSSSVAKSFLYSVGSLLNR